MLKIKEGFILRKVAGKYVVVAIGAAGNILNGMIRLNDSGAFCWKQLTKGCSKNELIDLLMNEYIIPKEQAMYDVDSFICTLREAGCLDLS